VSLDFEIKGDTALIRKLSRFHPEVIPAATRAIAEALKGYLAKYPGPVHKPIKWVSMRQRTAYIAQRRAAGLGPYVRNSDPFSQRLGPSWATQNRGIDAVVGTRVTYAPWVQSDKQQQPMHAATGWVTDKQAIEKAQAAHVADRIWKQIVEKWDK
jgi:hypothetical protein